MKVQLTLKNYRCFASPATIDIQKGSTAFVGMNNAGKSAMMRFFLEFRMLLQQLSNHHYFASCIHSAQPFSQFLHVLDQQEVFSNLNINPIEVEFDCFSEGEEENEYRHAKVLIEFLRNLTCKTAMVIDGLLVDASNFQGLNDSHMMVAGKAVLNNSFFTKLFQPLTNTLYIGPFRNTINIGTKADYLDISIGESFIAQYRQLKTGPNKKDNTDVSRLTEQIRQVFRFKTLDISPAHDNSSLHLTVNGKPYKQHELGSGLSHFIIVLANAAMKSPDWIFIDEPEMNLHPSLQLDFLRTLGSYAKEGVLFSTHSLGLARTAAEKVYSVWKESDGNSKVRSLAGTPRLAEFLGEMSFSNQKELGFERILLVEGPTDVKVIQEFLRMISKDGKIFLLPLHGHMPQADELEETLRITTNVAALIDSEKESEGDALNRDRQEFLDLCVRRGLACHVLNRRAMENYFPDPTIKEVFGQKYRCLQPYEKLSQAEPHWSKNHNWKLAAAMKFNAIRTTDLGIFLESL